MSWKFKFWVLNFFLKTLQYTVLEIQFRSSYYTVVTMIRNISSKTFWLEKAVKVKGAILEIYASKMQVHLSLKFLTIQSKQCFLTLSTFNINTRNGYKQRNWSIFWSPYTGRFQDVEFDGVKDVFVTEKPISQWLNRSFGGKVCLL